MPAALSDRQQREIAYHREHAANAGAGRITYDVLFDTRRRWWNAYWDLWTFLTQQLLIGRRMLVVGCGTGEDAIYFAKLGAIVSAFDLSPDMLAIAQAAAHREQLAIDFGEMPAERQTYPDDTFDLVFARDILHHVEIDDTMREISRVAKPGAMFAVTEIYSHSITERVRRSWAVERLLYPAMRAFVYGGEQIYITQDERKLTERDVASIMRHLRDLQYHKYFNFVVTRLVPNTAPIVNKADYLALRTLGPLGRFVAGRISIVGVIAK